MSDTPENKSETEMLYELGFHLLPTLSEEEVQKEFNGIKEAITKSGGEITVESAPALLDLQYTMVQNIDSVNHKYETAHFGWVKFISEPANVTVIEEYLDGTMNVLRRLIVKTVEAANVEAADVAAALEDKDEEESEGKDGKNVKAAKKEEKTEATDDKESEEATEKPEEVNEEVDKAIDELVEDKA